MSKINPNASQRRPRGVQKTPKSVKEASRRRKGRFSRVLQLKMGSRRHPRGVQGVQNEPKSVPEAPTRRPRPSKKRPGGKKLDLVVFYRLFKRPQVTGRHQAGSRNNLPVREVNRTIIFTNTNSSAKSTATGARPNTHWCARGHGADLKAKASCRRPPKIYNYIKFYKLIKL